MFIIYANHGILRLRFIDFTNLSNSNNYMINNTKFDYIYSRFSFHTINEKNDDKTLGWIKNHLGDGLFLLGARSINDVIFKKGKQFNSNENFTNHYMRYFGLVVFKSKLVSLGFKILFKIENNNLAVYNEDNPHVIRIITSLI